MERGVFITAITLALCLAVAVHRSAARGHAYTNHLFGYADIKPKEPIKTHSTASESAAHESPFADLSVEEMNQVINYMFKQQDIKLKDPTEACITDAVIFLVEAIRPNKAAAVGYLDSGKPAPERAARVVIHRGDLKTPVVEEYRVAPIPNPTTHKIIKSPDWKDPIPFNARSILGINEWGYKKKFITKELLKINDILSDMTGGWTYGNCTDHCLFWEPGVPTHAKANVRKIAPWLFKSVEGAYLHPIGVQFVINVESLDIKQWSVEHVWFQGQDFKNFDELRKAYRDKKLKIIKIPEVEGLFTKKMMSSLNFRGEPRPSESKRGPRTYMPDGQRFTVNGRQISWLGWEFEFSMLASTGIQLNNVNFLKERIAYELSVQEIAVFYSGGSPVASHNAYYDTYIILGTQTSELFIGIDCPNYAKFFDVVHYMDGKPLVFKNAVCVFEHNRGVPIRRHTAPDYVGGYTHAQGMLDNVLILRQVLTVDNYDYIIDFMFHQAGQIEGKVSLTGYVLSTFYTGPTMDKYGHVLNVPLGIANIHHHALHIKADLDIKGHANRFATLDIRLEEIEDLLPQISENLTNRYFERSLKRTEKEAAYSYNFTTPKYLVMYNENETNKFGQSQGYRILSDGMSKMLLPKSYRGYRSRAWAEYQVAVTKHKDTEWSSSSIYATMEQFDPVVSFEDFIKDDEPIVDEDLVAWITMGSHHIPHTEDVPIVTTPGVQLTFYLLPYNYFDEDPSMASRDNIRVTPTENGGKEYEYAGVKADHDEKHGSCPISTASPMHAFNLAVTILIPVISAYHHHS